MKEILDNEIARQEDMEMRYRMIGESQFKNDDDEVGKVEKNEEKEETEMKYAEDVYYLEKLKILEELGLITNNNDNKETIDSKK